MPEQHNDPIAATCQKLAKECALRAAIGATDPAALRQISERLERLSARAIAKHMQTEQ